MHGGSSAELGRPAGGDKVNTVPFYTETTLPSVSVGHVEGVDAVTTVLVHPPPGIKGVHPGASAVQMTLWTNTVVNSLSSVPTGYGVGQVGVDGVTGMMAESGVYNGELFVGHCSVYRCWRVLK